jgi:antitoxin Phd
VHIESEWKLADAKENLSRVVDRALEGGPQRVTRDGSDAVIVLSEQDFNRLVSRQRDTLTRFLAESALRDVDIDVRSFESEPRSCFD